MPIRSRTARRMRCLQPRYARWSGGNRGRVGIGFALVPRLQHRTIRARAPQGMGRKALKLSSAAYCASNWQNDGMGVFRQTEGITSEWRVTYTRSQSGASDNVLSRRGLQGLGFRVSESVFLLIMTPMIGRVNVLVTGCARFNSTAVFRRCEETPGERMASEEIQLNPEQCLRKKEDRDASAQSC